MQREADQLMQQCNGTAKVDESHLQHLGVGEEVVLLDVALEHHQRVARNADR